MASRNIVHVAPAEWRWLIVLSAALVLLVFVPLTWIAARGTPGWQFMGALHNYQDGATYFSKMTLGYQGEWLVTFQHTTEDHNGAFIQVIYLLLGHAARVLNIPIAVMFHVARAGASLFMYVSIYQLGAIIWSRVSTRRLFFAIAAVGAGFGWLYAPLAQSVMSPDFALIPEAFPLYSTFMNVHFPLTIACLALLVGLLIFSMQPGASEDPAAEQIWPLIGLLSFTLAFLYPQVLVPIGAATGLYVAASWLRDRRPRAHHLRVLGALVLPAAPIALYYVSVIAYSPALQEWNRQNVTAAPAPWELAIGFGLPLLLAVPGLIKAARRFDGGADRLMLLWLLSMIVAIYLPTNIQRRFAAAMMIPIAYFATRSLIEFWLPRLAERWRMLAIVGLVVVIVISPILVLFIPVLPAVTGNPQRAQGVFLEEEYAVAYRWLADRTTDRTVILASPLGSVWVPGWTRARVVYGHPYETLNGEAKLAQVQAWYAADASAPECGALIEQYGIDYVLVGAQERALGAGACVDTLRLAAQFGTLDIYVP